MGGKKDQNKKSGRQFDKAPKPMHRAADEQHIQQLDALANDRHISQFQESILKFTDSLIASTSSASEEIQIWEPKTLAPYEPVRDNKFIASPNTLQVCSQNYIWACQANKNIMSVWRWDKKDPILRFPLKEQLSVFKVSQSAQENYTSNICVGGAKSGAIFVWKAIDGQLLADVEDAHYMDVMDLDVSKDNTDMIVTGGKDCKVKVWFLATIMRKNPQEKQHFVEFSQHTQEVTSVAFSQSCSNRIFSASIDKQIKIYDISQKMCLKTIQAHSQIHKMLIDTTETQAYVGCDNQNIYVYSLEIQPGSQAQPIGDNQAKGRQKKTLQHKKKVTSLCLSVDGKYLISGDSTGLIYLWSTATINDPSGTLAAQMFGINQQSLEQQPKQKTPPQSPQGGNDQTHNGLITTYELHKDKGAITNLVPLFRPLSLFGLTANMKSFEVQEIKALKKFRELAEEKKEHEPIDFGLCLSDPLTQNQESSSYLNSRIEESELDNYFIQCSQNLMKTVPDIVQPKPQQVDEKQDIDAGEGQVINSSSNTNTDLQRLKEENKLLKRTLMERFDQQYA